MAPIEENETASSVATQAVDPRPQNCLKRLFSRFDLDRSGPTTCLIAVMRFVPAPVIYALTKPVVLVVYTCAGARAQGVRDNLSALLCRRPGTTWWAGFQVFSTFSFTYLDHLYHTYFQHEITWEIDGLEIFEQLKAEPGGVVLFTAHCGNYDIAASAFSGKFGRRVNIVRVPERDESMQEIRSAELKAAEAEHSDFKVWYNRPDEHLGIALAGCIADGEIVAIQGDRVIEGVSPMEVPAPDGLTFTMPKGPLVLAAASRAPSYAIFFERTGRLAYKIHVEGPVHPGGRTKLDKLSETWAGVLHGFVRKHWKQWFVFERAVRR